MNKILTFLILFSVTCTFAQKGKIPYCTILEKYDGNVKKEQLVMGTPIVVHNIKKAKVINYDIIIYYKGFWETKNINSDNVDTVAIKLIDRTYGTPFFFTNIKCVVKNDTIDLNSIRLTVSSDSLPQLDILPIKPTICNKHNGRISSTELIKNKGVETQLDSSKYHITHYLVYHQKYFSVENNNSPFFTDTDISYFQKIPPNNYVFVGSIQVTDKSGKKYILPPIVLKIK